MQVKMEVEFTREEVQDICKAEYVRLFGKPAKGYRLGATSEYGGVTVTTVPDPTVEPEPVAAVTDQPPVFPPMDDGAIEMPAQITEIK